jgi:hypothetical protein
MFASHLQEGLHGEVFSLNYLRLLLVHDLKKNDDDHHEMHDSVLELRDPPEGSVLPVVGNYF